jgi:hypothetical protein
MWSGYEDKITWYPRVPVTDEDEKHNGQITSDIH